MSTSALLVVAAATGCFISSQWLWAKLMRARAGTRLPPGPAGVPLLGNLFDVPAVDSHLTYTELAKEYGPIMQLRVLTRVVLVVSDIDVARDLLDKRGSIYSDRPPYYMADAAGWDWHSGNMGHTEAWRVRRRLVQQKFHPSADGELRKMIRDTTIELLSNLLRSPYNFRDHIHRSAANNIMKSVYGIAVADKNDPYVDVVEKGVEIFGQLVMPGSTPVDQLPVLLRIPGWVPFFGQWTAKAQALRKYAEDLVEVPYARAKDDISQSIVHPCMVSDNFEESLDAESDLTEKIVKDACAVAYIGGADTTVAALLAFVMAMVCWPEYQQKAQHELDRVLEDRLPEFSDQDSLPYVEAIIRETYRMYPVTPLALPHAVEEDDVYRRMFIRKGTTVIPNVWAMMHDEHTYSDAHKFNPDRWMKDGKLDDSLEDPRKTGTFGFGRRICPARHFADDSVYLTVAMLLKCFDFNVCVKNGVQVHPSGEFHMGAIRVPLPFECTITPRSGREALINEAEQWK